MSKNPEVVNMQFTSFASKEPYKPPTGAFFNQSANTKKPKYVPGGEWAQDDDTFGAKAPTDATHGLARPEATPKADPELQKTGQSAEGGDKPKSKFKFIEKKREATANDGKKPNAVGVLEFSEIRSEQ